jgi:hypothetical protein
LGDSWATPTISAGRDGADVVGGAEAGSESTVELTKSP